MTMDYGDAAAPDPDGQMGEYGIQAVTALHAQLTRLYSEHQIPKSAAELWTMIGATPMIGLNDVVTETFDLQDAQETVDFALAQGMGLLSMWSLNRDHPCPESQWVELTCSSSPDQVADWEFSGVLGALNP